MSSPVKSFYSITGSIGMDDFRARVIIDEKNKSIHLHFYGKIFGTTPKPIVIKHSDTPFPEMDGIERVKQIISDEFTNKKVEIKTILTEKEMPALSLLVKNTNNGEEKEMPARRVNPPQRTIIRFRK